MLNVVRYTTRSEAEKLEISFAFPICQSRTVITQYRVRRCSMIYYGNQSSLKTN